MRMPRAFKDQAERGFAVLAEIGQQTFSRVFGSNDVAQALLPAVSRLVSTPVRRGNKVSKRNVGMSADGLTGW